MKCTILKIFLFVKHLAPPRDCASANNTRGGGGGGGGGFYYFHTFVGSGHFLGFKILNFNDFFFFGGGGGFRKINIFWGMKILWIFLWGHHKIGLYLGVISMHVRVFS